MHPPWLMALTICAMPLGAAVLFFSITRILRLLREHVPTAPASIERENFECGRSPWRNI
jgi:NADH:ubiquinone oxidoreductase subunit 3 (subunit A)